MPAEYWRDYRRRHAAELREYNRQRRKLPRVRAQRHAFEAQRRMRLRAARASLPVPIPMLYPHLQRGGALSFWEDELRIDLAQERHLAILEGRDPDDAVRRYRAREMGWRAVTYPLPEGQVAA